MCSRTNISTSVPFVAYYTVAQTSVLVASALSSVIATGTQVDRLETPLDCARLDSTLLSTA